MNFGQLDWGKTNRLAQIFKRNKKGEYHTVMLAMDHPYFYGPTTGLIDPRKTMQPLVPYADAISPAKGTLEYCLDAKVPVPVILRVTGGNSMRMPDQLSDEEIITSVEEAVKLNAVGVSISVYIDSPHQKQTLKNLGQLANECSKYGLLVLGITATGAELKKRLEEESDSNRNYFAHAGRIIQENGANIVKTYYTKGFEEVREGIQVPIVIAGGKKVPELDALTYTYNSIQAGAEGIDMGRNIFQADNPVAMIQAISSVVHKGKTPQEAYRSYKELSKKE